MDEKSIEDPKPIERKHSDYKAKQVKECYDASDDELAELGIRIRGMNRKIF